MSRAEQNPLRVAENPRPLVEGALHRRFSGLIREGHTFGEFWSRFARPPRGARCSGYRQLQSFHSFNDYAGAYHHDTFGAFQAGRSKLA